MDTRTLPIWQEVTQQDIAPLCAYWIDKNGFGFDKNGKILPLKGVAFLINPVGLSPEATFSQKFTEAPVPLPKGSIIKLDANGAEEYVLPGQQSKDYRWINGEFMLMNK